MNKAKGKAINSHTVNSVQTELSADLWQWNSGCSVQACPETGRSNYSRYEWRTTEPIHDPQFRLYNPHIHPL